MVSDLKRSRKTAAEAEAAAIEASAAAEEAAAAALRSSHADACVEGDEGGAVAAHQAERRALVRELAALEEAVDAAEVTACNGM